MLRTFVDRKSSYGKERLEGARRGRRPPPCTADRIGAEKYPTHNRQVCMSVSADRRPQREQRTREAILRVSRFL